MNLTGNLYDILRKVSDTKGTKGLIKEYPFDKVKEYYDILEENNDEIDENLDWYTTEEEENNCYVVRNYRLVIPDLHVSFREGDWYYRSNVDEDWEEQESGFLRYDECEKDINKYLSYVSGYLSYSLYDILKENGQKDINVDDLSCYIEFDEMP